MEDGDSESLSGEESTNEREDGKSVSLKDQYLGAIAWLLTV